MGLSEVHVGDGGPQVGSAKVGTIAVGGLTTVGHRKHTGYLGRDTLFCAASQQLSPMPCFDSTLTSSS